MTEQTNSLNIRNKYVLGWLAGVMQMASYRESKI